MLLRMSPQDFTKKVNSQDYDTLTIYNYFPFTVGELLRHASIVIYSSRWCKSVDGDGCGMIERQGLIPPLENTVRT